MLRHEELVRVLRLEAGLREAYQRGLEERAAPDESAGPTVSPQDFYAFQDPVTGEMLYGRKDHLNDPE